LNLVIKIACDSATDIGAVRHLPSGVDPVICLSHRHLPLSHLLPLSLYPEELNGGLTPSGCCVLVSCTCPRPACPQR
jgi:hypothetical protein